MVMVGLAYGVSFLVHYRDRAQVLNSPHSHLLCGFDWETEIRELGSHMWSCVSLRCDVQQSCHGIYNCVMIKRNSPNFCIGFQSVKPVYNGYHGDSITLGHHYVNSWLLLLDWDQEWLQWPLQTLFTIWANHIADLFSRFCTWASCGVISLNRL